MYNDQNLTQQQWANHIYIEVWCAILSAPLAKPEITVILICLKRRKKIF